METLSLKRSILEYLNQTGNLQSIKQQCHIQSSQQKPGSVYRYLIMVYPADLLDLNAHLGNIVLHKPTEARTLFQEVVHTIVNTLKLLPYSLSCTQILVVMRLLALPPLLEYQVNKYIDLLNAQKAQHFVQIDGVITGRTIVSKYTQSAKYRCPVRTCSAAQSDRYIRLHVPGAREFQTVRKDFNCMNCGSILQEDVNCRVLADKMIIEVVPENALHRHHTAARCQVVSVYVRDELVNGLEIGSRCVIIGLPWHDTFVDKIAIEANNIIFKSEHLKIVSSIQSLPQQIFDLFQDRKLSPWSFGLSLAYSLAGHVSPPGTYLHLKLGLLLSLMGQLSESCRLDVLAVGNDTLALQRILQYALTLADKNMCHSYGCHLVAGVSKDRYRSGACFIDGGSLLLADDGISFLGDLGNYKKIVRENLQKALEGRQVTLDVPPRLSGGPSHQLFLPLRCRVWGYIDTNTHCKRKAQSILGDPFIAQQDVVNISKPLADVFGMAYFTDMDADTYADYCSIHQTLQQSLVDGHTSYQDITSDDLRQFIMYASHQKLSISSEAESLISGYYLASRRVRSTSISATEFPVTAIQTISSLAEAHAKLNLNKTVLETDALMAILLYEEAIAKRYGYSVINIKPLAHIKDGNITQYIGHENDETMKQLHKQLIRFIQVHDNTCYRFLEE